MFFYRVKPVLTGSPLFQQILVVIVDLDFYDYRIFCLVWFGFSVV